MTFKRIKKEYSSEKEFFEDVEQHLSHGGVLLSSPSSLEIRQEIEVEIWVSGKKITQLIGEVVCLIPKEQANEIGIQLKDNWEEKIKVVRETLESASDEIDRQWGKDSESLFHNISKMNVHEKIQLAVRGGREERRILLKDSHYSVHPYVLKNPRITLEEVSFIARMPGLTGEMIQTISNNSEWMEDHTVRYSLVKNPKTPSVIVQKHLPKLNNQDLLQLAKSDHVRESVSKLAKRTLAARGKPVS